MTTRTMNPVRTYKTQAGATLRVLAYVRDIDGTPLPADTEPESVILQEEFGNRRTFSCSTNACSVFAPRGTDSSPEAVWSPGIDGKSGYNMSFQLLGLGDTDPQVYEAFYEPLYGSVSVAVDPLRQGWYRLRATFPNGTIQEFSISVRD